MISFASRRAAPLFVALSLAIATVGFASPAHAQDKKAEAAAKALQKKAMEEDYLTTDFAKAQEKLDKAYTQCGEKCSPTTRALLKRDLGVVLVGGQVDKDKGVAAFAEALKLDPTVTLDPDLKTKDIEAAFEQAKKKGGKGGGAPAPAPAAGGGKQPDGDFVHTPVSEQQIRTPVPIYVEYQGEEKLVKVMARYKGLGMGEWKSLELRKLGEGWGAQTPCGDVQQGAFKYYIQGFNSENDAVAVAGDRNTPYEVAITREAVAEAPHLPDQPAPKQCADTGDCPPDFPGCKDAKKKPVDDDEPKGKEGGASCEEDSECKSGTCADGFCTEPTKKKFPRVWVGLFGAFDISFIPSSTDACKLASTGLPTNAENYYCTRDDGSDYPFRPEDGASPERQAELRAENDRIQVDEPAQSNAGDVIGGARFGNIRIMASFDYAVTTNVLVGLRAGVVIGAYTGDAGKQDGKTSPLAPIHLEVRGTYVFGKDALAKAGFAPYLFGGLGVSTFDAKIPVPIHEGTGASQVRVTRDAWHLGGPGFLSIGGGARYAITPNVALMGGARVNAAFGNAFQLSLGPEAGVQVGF